jgi:predicted MFS family arabinose efflux permease
VRVPLGLVLALLTVRLADETAWFLPAGLFETFRRDLGLTYTEASVVLILAAPGSLLGTAGTVAADFVSRRVLACAGAVTFALALAAFAAGGSFWVLAGASLAMGAGATVMVDACEVALVDLAGDDLPAYLARQNLFGVVGDLAGPALLLLAAGAGLGWRATFGLTALLMAGYAALLGAQRFPPPLSSDEANGPRAGLAAVLRDRRVWWIGALAVFLTPMDESFLGFTIAFLERVRGASPSAAVATGAAFVAGGLLATTVVARRVRAWPVERTLTASALVLFAATVAVPVVPWLPLVAAAGLAFSTALTLFWLALQHEMLTVRPGQAGTTSAVVSVIEMGGFFVPIVIGWVADAAGLRAALWAYTLVPAVIVMTAARFRSR